MLAKLTAFLSPYKWLIYAALAASVVSAWAWDRKAQFNRGVAATELKQSEAKADYWESRSSRLAEEGKAALIVERSVGNKVSALEQRRNREVEREVAKPVSDSCLYSDSELLELETLIRETGEGSIVVPANSSGRLR